MIGDAMYITNIVSASSYTPTPLSTSLKRVKHRIGLCLCGFADPLAGHFLLNHYFCNERRNENEFAIDHGPYLSTEPKPKTTLTSRMRSNWRAATIMMKDKDALKSVIIRTPLRDGCSPLVCLFQTEFQWSLLLEGNMNPYRKDGSLRQPPAV